MPLLLITVCDAKPDNLRPDYVRSKNRTARLTPASARRTATTSAMNVHVRSCRSPVSFASGPPDCVTPAF